MQNTAVMSLLVDIAIVNICLHNTTDSAELNNIITARYGSGIFQLHSIPK